MKNARVRVRVRVNASASASASTSAFLDRLTPSLRHFGEATRSFLQEAASVPGRLKRSAEQHRELGRPSGIQYICIEVSDVALIMKLILDAAASCGRGRVRCLERAKRACSSQTVLAGGQAWLRLALIRAATWLPRTTIGRCSSRRCFRLCMLCSRAGVAPGGASVLGPSFAPRAVHAAWTLP